MSQQRLIRYSTHLVISIIFIVSLNVMNSAAASEVRFKSGRSALKIPFKLFNNHIYLRVSVNGSAPLWFVLDTGAPNILALKHARALRLKLISAGQTSGSGEKTQESFFADDQSLTIAGVTVTSQSIGVLAMERLEICSNEIDVDEQGSIYRRPKVRTGDQLQPFDGVLGENFLRLFVVEIDYSSQFINLYDPSSYKYEGKGESIPLEVRNQNIFIRAPIKTSTSESVTGTFLVDTGMMTALSLNTPFIKKNQLMPPDDQTTHFEVCGIGGGAPTRIGTLDSIKLGNVEVKSPITQFSQASSGNLSKTDWDGLIGNAILRHFKVVVDYSRKRMILELPTGNN